MFAITVFPFKSASYFSRLFFSSWFIFGGPIGGIFNTINRLNKTYNTKICSNSGRWITSKLFIEWNSILGLDQLHLQWSGHGYESSQHKRSQTLTDSGHQLFGVQLQSPEFTLSFQSRKSGSGHLHNLSFPDGLQEFIYQQI